MKNIALKIAYDGSNYFGWQKTNTGPSIEETLESTLKKILNKEKIVLQAASRTDRGVHAEGQIVNFTVDKKISETDLLKSLNALLPKEITIFSAKEVPLDFHPTLWAEKKTYQYYICTGPNQFPKFRYYSWHVPQTLDIDLMQEGARFFLGEHDFSSLCNFRKNLTYENKRREIFELTITPIDPNRLKIEITGNHFLYKMVRNLVGTLVYLGIGKIRLEEIPLILEAKERKRAGITAPAHGLFLKEIIYPTANGV